MMIRDAGIKTETGDFGADMLVDISNDGPVTLIVESITKATQSV